MVLRKMYPLLNLAASAKNPFLFIASVLRFKRVLFSGDIKALDEITVSMDASSSAYQIMSFLLLDESEAADLQDHLPRQARRMATNRSLFFGQPRGILK